MVNIIGLFNKINICVFRKFFNFYCAGCGGTRMLIALFRLDFYQAFRYNPGMFILLCIIMLLIIINILLFLFKKKFLLPGRKAFIGTIIVLIIYTIFRNVPGFEFLLPTTL